MPRLSWPSWAPRSMPRLPLTGALLASGLGRRILLLFLLASGLPLLLLGLGSAQMVETLAAVAGRREQARVLQLAALQVHERLLLARDLMRDWPEPDLARPGRAPALPGLGRGFVRALHLDAQGRVDAGDAATRELLDGMTAQRAGTLQVRERNGRALVLMSMASPQGGRWLAELSPSYLWQPMLESAPEALWCVQDVQGVRLHCPAAPSGQGDADAADGAAVRRQLHTSWSLFLDGDFAAPGPGDWRFDLVAPPPPFELAGMTMVRLLSGAVGSTLILVALLSVSLVRRTLGPLQQLRAGVDRLERREGGARVDLRGRDEFGELGQAFNRMAARIDAQFDSLQLLASIDRDIVARREVDELFRRVLVQALLPLECRVMALASVEPGRVPRLLLQWNDRRHLHKVRRSLRVLTPVEHQALLAVDQDGDWAGAAWARALGEGLKVLPLRWQARTLGVLLIGWERAPAPERLGHAAELRDRLAVALAAHQRERELTWQACHDDLTGLLSRNGLHQLLDERLEPAAGVAEADSGAQAAEPALAVLFIDLDNFKSVNDSLGHGLGDELLRQAADRLEGCAPVRSPVARPGGDEFVIVLPGAGAEQAVEVAAAVCRRMAVPFQVGGREHFLGASVGIALAPEHGRSRSALLRHADMAMYIAKEGGRGRHVMFEAPLDARLSERSALLADLRQAVARDELVLHFQPRVGVHAGRIVSAEALVRWQHPVRGLVPPGVFIPLAEESDLIAAIGLWVLDRTCAQLARWRRDGLAIQRVSVNVSPRQLQSGRLVEEVEAALVRHGVPWQQLELEVTESLLVGDARQASAQLTELRQRGVLVALDDFGTGYSSMATLRDLPVDVMKVDRAFVRDLGSDASALAITRAILTLAQSLGKHTVAEGIEVPAQAEALQRLGCDELQGYLFGRPMPAAEFERLCRTGLGAPASMRPATDAALPA